MAYNLPQNLQIFQVSGLDGTVLNQTINIFTVPAGVRFYPDTAIIELTATSGLVSVATLSIGSASSYNDILAASALTAVNATNKVLNFSLNLTAGNTSIAAGTVIGAKVTVAAVSTTYSLRVVLTGILI
jgi:hypothetical protein